MKWISSFTLSQQSLGSLLIIVHILTPTEQIIYKRNGHYRISEYPTNDESYLQTKNAYDMVWNVVEGGLGNLFNDAPVWGREDPKYLDQIKFNCFMYNGEAAEKINNETSRFIKKDFTFTSRDVKENPERLKAIFKGRKNQRFGFLFHGYSIGHRRYDIHLKPYFDVIAADLRSKLQMNVIFVDWTELSVWVYFVAAKANTLYAAEAARAAIHAMANVMEMSEEDKINYMNGMLVLGHSLGAQVAGMVGHLLTQPAMEKGKPKIKMLGTIVGLDPAGPYFPPYGTMRHCLTLNDAKRVLIIHSDTVLTGSSYRTGHEDWYVHGGAEIVPSSPGLSHGRASNLFRELIWYQAVGYILMQPNHVYRDNDMSDPSMLRRIDFDLTKIPVKDSEIIPYPIYLPANLRYPYFDNNQTPKKIPAYSKSKKKGWERMLFKSPYRFIPSIQLDELENFI